MENRASKIRHDMRGCMNALKLCVSALDLPLTREESDEFLGDVEYAAMRMIKLIDEMAQWQGDSSPPACSTSPRNGGHGAVAQACETANTDGKAPGRSHVAHVGGSNGSAQGAGGDPGSTGRSTPSFGSAADWNTRQHPLPFRPRPGAETESAAHHSFNFANFTLDDVAPGDIPGSRG